MNSNTTTTTMTTRNATGGDVTSECTCSLCREGIEITSADETLQKTCCLRQVSEDETSGDETHSDETSQTTYTFQRAGSNLERGDTEKTSQATYSLRRIVGERLLSPTRAGRLEEKQQLEDLNDRFASYIDRVRYLESENRRLVSQVRLTEETESRGVENVKSMYDKELDDARRLLEEMSKEKDGLEFEAGKNKADSVEWQTKYRQLDYDQKNTDKRILELEAQFASLSARYADIESQKNYFEKKHSSVRTDILSVEHQLEKAQKQVEAESFLCTDLENNYQTLKDDLATKTQGFEQELNEFRTRTAVRVDEVDAGLRVDYEAKLQAALQRMRAEQDASIRATKTEVESMYEIKIGDLQNALDTSQNSGVSTREDMISIRRQLADLSTEASNLKAQMAQYESRIADLESQLRLEQDGFFSRIADKDSQIGELRKSLDEQLKEFAHLMDIKIRLDTEIAAYRKLLESEESRLNLSERFNESTTHNISGQFAGEEERVEVKETTVNRQNPTYLTTSHSHSTTFGKNRHTFGKNRDTGRFRSFSEKQSSGKSEYQDAASSSDITSRFRSVSGGGQRKTTLTSGLKRKHTALNEFRKSSDNGGYTTKLQSNGDFEIYKSDINGRVIKLRNISSKDVNVGSWQLKNVADGQETIYKFRQNLVLKAGQHVAVWSADSGKTQTPPTTLVMEGQKWNVGDEIETTLYNTEGEEVASRYMTKLYTGKDTTDLRTKAAKTDSTDSAQCSVM